MPQLRRALGLLQATATVVGIIIGAAIFVQPSEVMRYVGGDAGVLAVWCVAGVLTLAGALVCAGLAREFPETGGIYVYLERTIGPAAGYLWGWAMFWMMHSGIIAAVAIILARYAATFVALGLWQQRGVAVGAIAAMTLVNWRGTRAAGWLEVGLTAAKLAGIVGIVAAAWFLPPRFPPPEASAAAAGGGVGGFLLALAAALYAYGGWHMGTYAAGETRQAERNIPCALLGGVAIVTACYIGLNAAYLHLLPLGVVRASTRVAADAAGVLIGQRGAAAVAAVVIVSALGGLNGLILAGPRVYYAMARRGWAPAALGHVSERYATPDVALAAQAVWAALLVTTGSYRALFNRVVYTEWLFFGLLALGWMRYRKRWSPSALAFALACGLVVVNEIVADPRNGLWGMAFLFSGLPVYWWYARRGVALPRETIME